jgi:hypothetical protein
MTILTKQAGRFTEAEIDDEIVVMHLGTGEFFSLSGTAAATWRLIDGQRDRHTLVEALAQEFAAESDEIAREIDQFIEQLKVAGLVGED